MTCLACGNYPDTPMHELECSPRLRVPLPSQVLLPHLEQVHAKQVASEEVLARGASDIIELARESVRHAVADEAAKLALTYVEPDYFRLGLEVRADLVVVKDYSALAAGVREAIAEAYNAGLADRGRVR